MPINKLDQFLHDMLLPSVGVSTLNRLVRKTLPRFAVGGNKAQQPTFTSNDKACNNEKQNHSSCLGSVHTWHRLQAQAQSRLFTPRHIIACSTGYCSCGCCNSPSPSFACTKGSNPDFWQIHMKDSVGFLQECLSGT